MATFSAAENGRVSGSEGQPGGRTRRARRRMVAWDPGLDTLLAAVTLLGFWGCYFAGSTVHGAFLIGGILVFGTLVPAWAVLHQRREGLEGLGITRSHLRISLLVSALLGAGSVYQLFAVASELGVPVLPHLLGNLVVLWEPLFVFGWLFLRWERAFGWLPAILLIGVGFALQHVGSVPLPVAIGFAAFAMAFGIVFALVRNLLVLWPLFYPIGSGIGTLQSGLVFDWADVASGTVLLAVQVALLAGVLRWAVRSPRAASGPRRG